ncbi:MAG: BspA family leucine-rich repeat surface protein [Siphonobacter aquaeclarae]|nr:BspA family leucine-rich repeat surface protein [Siphonobacter aquaeclarae]
MKKLLLFTCLYVLATTFVSYAQIAPTDYVTTWNVVMRGDGRNPIEIPASGEYTVYYESIPAGFSGTLPATGTLVGQQIIFLPTAGTYRIAIRPTGTTPFHRITFGIANYNEQGKLLTIEQWGNTVWSSFQNAYARCENLSAISATDVPVLSNVTDMTSAFDYCKSLSSAPAMKNWDVSKVTKMGAMFSFAVKFNEPIGSWNVSKVTTMRRMFLNAAAFNQPIGNWDVSSVTNMSEMFYALGGAFNQPLGNWNTSAVTDMSMMFMENPVFNQPIGNWDVSSVTDMHQMFQLSLAFNQPLGNWNVSKVTNTGSMFSLTESFNQPLDNWDVSAVTYMYGMFGSAKAFNQSLASWTLNPSVVVEYMLYNNGMDCMNYSATLVGWATKPVVPSKRIFQADGRIYGASAAAAHNYLVANKGWTITGDVLDPGCSPLPVTLVSFSANVRSGNTVELAWQTSREINNDHFVIERSKDLKTFETVAEVRDVAGNSGTFRTYRAVDSAPYAGTSYYRLVQYDIDGSRTDSKPASVVVRSGDYTLYPNPLRNASFRVSVDEPITAQIQLHSAAGKSVAFTRKPEGQQTVVLTPSYPLAAGTYLITVRERATERTFRLVVL